MKTDLILYGGVVHGVDVAKCASAQAQAVAVADGRIAAVGEDAEILDLAGPDTRRVDLAGRCLVPGFEDAHLHMTMHGQVLRQVNLGPARSLDQALALVRAHAQRLPADAWVLGRGWNHNLWPGATPPTCHDLDAAVGDRPAALGSKDGHSLWVSSAALRVAGVDAGMDDPPGGEIRRDARGEPNGILTEKAEELVRRHVPAPSPEAMVEAARAALADAARLGVTAMHNCEGPAALAALQRLHEEGELTARIWQMIPLAYLSQACALGLRTGLGDDWLRIGHIKMFADGALGSGTAEMLEPYEDWPDRRGVAATESSELWEGIATGARHGLAPAIHAIGDAANRRVLDLYQRAREGGLFGTLPPHVRPRIEHVQLLTEADVPRMASLGVAASMQPIHATQDMEMADLHWGERARWGYAWRSVLDSGAVLAFGTDCPVESLDPLLGLYAAVTRQRIEEDGRPRPDGGWYPQERLSLEEALWAYTMGSARTCGQSRYRGSIAQGKAADLVVLSRDIFGGEPAVILEAKVDLTIVGGRIVYEA